MSSLHSIPAKRCWFSLLLAVLAPSVAVAQASARPNARFDAARQVIRQVMEENKIPSLSVAVAKDGKIIWEEGFGWADREKMIPATRDTLYSLASVTKPFTATGLMRLVELGKIDLDKPANEYLGASKITGLAGDASGATVRRVLSHTSGLPLHYQFFYENEPFRPSMEESIARYGILVKPPGEAYDYSNLGYGIIDQIIAHVSGHAYDDYMRTEVFAPLGLLHTSVDVGPGLEPYVAQRYDGQLRPVPFYTFDHRGGSAIYSSAHDLVRFGMFHLKDHLPDEQAILKDSAIDAMHEAETSIPTQPGLGYGLGWLTDADDHGYRVVFHTGGMPGVSTALALYPSEDLAVVILANKYGGTRQKVMEAIVASVLPKYAEALRRSGPKTPPKPEPYTPRPELLGKWAGTVRTWEGKIPFCMSFRPNGDIHVKLADELETVLNEVTYRDPKLEGRFAGRIPTADAKRYPHTVILRLRLRGDRLIGEATAETTLDSVHYALTSYVELERKTTAQ